MKEVSRTAIVGCPAALLYTLVNQLDHYPQWFSWCKDSAIVEHSRAHMLGRMTVKLAGMELSFSTDNILIPEQQIQMRLHDGPFKSLHGVWRFLALGQSGCRVSLQLQFDLGSNMLASVLSPAIGAWADRMVDDFIQVAKRTLLQSQKNLAKGNP